ncbi:hypothetical protein JW926_11625, partial [Candidatus Sumerlaeota bacterium]|nr:hypothetical protein [Candidatus Sumerlaeota bacterium]
ASSLLWALPTPGIPGGGYLFPLSVEAIALGVPGLSGSSTVLSARGFNGGIAPERCSIDYMGNEQFP